MSHNEQFSCLQYGSIIIHCLGSNLNNVNHKVNTHLDVNQAIGIYAAAMQV